jgi:hypothetical protein
MKSDKLPSPIAWILLSAFALRVGWVLLCWQRSGPTLEFADEELHWQLASNLVREGALVSDDGRHVARMPVYPVFLALFAWLGPVGILCARLAQCALSTAGVWVAARVTGAAFGRKARVIAAILMAVDPYTVFFCNLLLTEIPFILIAVGLFAAGVRLWTAPEDAQRRDSGWFAVLGALAIMTRPSSAGWVALMWLMVLLRDPRRARAIKRVAICAGVLGAMMLPWGLRNRAVVGHFAWLSANGGLTLYDAQGPQANGGSDQSFLAMLPGLSELGEVERDRRLAALAVDQMRADPARVVRLAGTKFVRTWSLTPNVAEYRHGLTAIASAVFSGFVLVGAAAGLWRHARRRPHLIVALALPVVYFTLVHCVFIGSLRYRIPVMPFVEITAAAALTRRHEACGWLGPTRSDA